MDRVVKMNFSTWQGMRTRDPRRLVLGTAGWGAPYGIANQNGQPTREAIGDLLEQAERAGIRCLDTARAYPGSEVLVGELTAAADAQESWRVVTKLDPSVHTPGLGLGDVLERVAESLAESRRALESDALPTLLLHRAEHRHVCGGRLWRMLLAERDAGRIGSLGVSAASPEQAWAALEDPDIEVLQVATSLLDLRLYRQGFFARARELGRTVYVRSVYLQGIAHLDPARLPEPLAGLGEALRPIHGLARELGVPARTLFLAFVREIPGALPVLGFENAAQLAEALEDWDSDVVGAASLAALVDALPEIPDALLDPSRWPSFEVGAARRIDAGQERRDAEANRTGPPSVATLRA